jgi:MFS family permease
MPAHGSDVGGSGATTAGGIADEPSLPPAASALEVEALAAASALEADSFKAEMRELRPLFIMAFLEVCSVGLLSARLPILLTTAFAREHGALAAWHDGASSGRCEVALSWVSPSADELRANATALAAACPLPRNAATPCCAADGRLSFPDSCPPGVTALGPAQPGSNFYYPHSAICTAGNQAAVSAQSSSDAAVLLLTFVCSPVLGKIADAYGRRPMLVAAEVAHLLPSVALLLWAYEGVSVYAFFVTRAFTGAANSISVALAYIADKTSPRNRAPAFGLLLATATLGVVTAPIGASMDAKPLATTAVAGHLVTIVYTWWRLPESLPPPMRTAFAPAALSPLSGLAVCVRTPTAKLLTAILCLSGMGNRGLQDITSFFLQGAFGFDSMMLARLLLLLALALLLLQGVALKHLIARLGEAGVLLLATTACVCYDWSLAAAATFSGQPWTAYLICGSLAMLGAKRTKKFQSIENMKFNVNRFA